ncbi:MAG: chemotaxis response regulator protein-glutamate methylesterase [Myxococcota bacterium]
MGDRLRVVVVDDSAAVRKILKWGLELEGELEGEIEVVGMAPDARHAMDLIARLEPDVVTLDVDMPGMNGIELLRTLLPVHPVPVVMLSALTQAGSRLAFEAIAAGAVDFVPKPTSEIAESLPAMLAELRARIRGAARVNMSAWRQARRGHDAVAEAERAALRVPARARVRIVAIGASTGGPEALLSVLPRLPADTPGVVVVQHMPAGYTTQFAESLDERCAMRVKEAAEGDRVESGRVLLAPGDRHLRVRRGALGLEVTVDHDERVTGHRPSVDALFASVAAEAGAKAVGAILTGMGRDGAKGLLAMRRAGARTLAQDHDSSIVFGMPKVAIELGAVERVVPLDRVAVSIVEALG